MAYKYPPEEKETVLRDILLQTGRTGRVTLVAVFDGIALAGTLVTNATLHNQGRINELNLHVGDTLVVRKAGDIIRSFTTIGEMESYLYVSDYPEEWEQDRADIREGQQLVYVYNKDDPALSELGYIGVTRTEAAGLHRTW